METKVGCAWNVLGHLRGLSGPDGGARVPQPWVRSPCAVGSDRPAELFCIIRVLEPGRDLKGYLVQPSLCTDKEVK